MASIPDEFCRCLKEWEEQRAQLAAIKELVCGEAAPRWPNDLQVTAMRYRIADLCDMQS